MSWPTDGECVQACAGLLLLVYIVMAFWPSPRGNLHLTLRMDQPWPDECEQATTAPPRPPPY